MNFRPRPGLTLAVAAAALAGTAPMSPPAAADDEPLVEHCYTQALTPEQVEAGEVSQIDCYQVPADEPFAAMRSTVVWAIVYDIDPSTGSAMMISSPTGVTSCSGGSVVFGVGNPWDNIISSTEIIACGSAKHWANANYTGSNQLKTGSGILHYITGAMNNATSSIQYA
jgi:hypothetical protein